MSLVFGRDYMPKREAESAPAWPSLAQVEGRRKAAYNRLLKAAQADMGMLTVKPHEHVPFRMDMGGRFVPARTCWYCHAELDES